MKKICVISTKNPNHILFETISKIKEYYTDFEIIIVDSDSDDLGNFKKIPKDVKIELIKNKNWELGAWNYAFNKYNNYDVYMFIQDSLIPHRAIAFDYNNILENDYVYSCHYTATLEKGGHLKHLKDVYKDTELSCIFDVKDDTIITGAAHSSFVANSNITKKIIELEKIYIDKKICKTKIDSLLSERTVGMLCDRYAKKRINMWNDFKKVNLKRDY
jgi:glycosyltransferase involved in cell wall biosynthesis